MKKTKPLKIKRWIRDGNEGFERQKIETQDELLEAAGRLLDKSCSGDIVGECVFQATDGKHYVGTVEFVISECSPGYLADLLQEDEEDE